MCLVIRTTFDNMRRVIPEYSELSTNREDSNLLITGAKGYYLGGGWWRISGYSQNGRDVDIVMDILAK